MNLTQLRFLGFQNTPFLWSKELFGLKQFQLNTKGLSINKKLKDTIRLGNYVERLVSFQLSQHNSIQILIENAQIIADKITLGEMDCLILKDKQPIHLEIAYKFYLYDPSVGNSFFEHWIGPNRRDSLVLKLKKIREKQFPLLYSDACKPLLNELGLKAEEISQQTFFKAQLYVPFKNRPNFSTLNSDCVYGFYMHSSELELFKDCKFFIPRKLDWLIIPHSQVAWMYQQSAKNKIQEYHQKQSAPLCWIKQPNGEILKVFVVYW